MQQIPGQTAQPTAGGKAVAKESEQPKKSRLWLWILLALIAIGAILAIYFFFIV